MLSLLRRCIEAVDRLGDSGKRSSLGYRQILLGRVPIFFRFDEEQITMRERACLGDCIVGSLAIFALLAIIGHCRGCLPIITVVICDAQRVSFFFLAARRKFYPLDGTSPPVA